ncbi:MAG: response regulator, partial [Thermoleophilia bacterium]|nr:response regulator [Thermoleophilia bacterium]
MKRVLIVDDHEENLHLLEVLLESQGYSVTLTSNGAEALKAARQDPPDLVVSDILMPVMDGFSLCRAWKTDEKLRAIPFVFYTATYTDLRDEQLALSLGADAFITKPAEPEDFLARLLATLARTDTTPHVPPQETPVELESLGKQYNEALVRKLEDKMLQLERTKHALEQEIAERERAERALQESESRFRHLFETMAQGVIYSDIEGRPLLANPAAERMLGVGSDDSPALTTGATGWEVVDESGEGLQPDQFPDARALRTGRPVSGTIVGVRRLPDGERRWVMIEAVPQLLPGATEPSGTYTTITDVTERKLAMDALRHQATFDELIEDLLSRIASASPAEVDGCIAESMQPVAQFMDVDSIIVLQTSEELTFWSATYWWAGPGIHTSAAALQNMPRETFPWVEDTLLSGQRIVIHSPDDIPQEDSAFRALWLRQRLSSAVMVPLHGRGGIFRGGLGLFRAVNRHTWEHQDIRQAEQLAEAVATALERKHAEDLLRATDERLRQSQKMEAIGQLAGGIAHDFNNLLTAIIGYSNLILQKPGISDPSIESDVIEIRNAAEKASALTGQILAFSRRQTLQPTVVSINDVIADMEPLLRRTLGESIDLVTVPDPGLSHVEVDTHQFEQVVLNLAVNARDAMPSGGRLVLQTTNVHVREGQQREYPAVTPGDHVLLIVSDTGSGMDERTRAHAFEPFFTTKETGKGTGLGLSTVYGIVKQSEGSVFIESEPGAGTTFKILLPKASAPARVAPHAAAKPAPTRGHETVLV